jgi:hypothetical protein
MAKQVKKSPVVISKQKLLLPKMEFFVLDEATGEGFYVRELGGKSLLGYREKIAGIEGDPTVVQSLDMMIELVYLSASNADGTPFFVSRDEADLFAEASIGKVQSIADKAMELSGMSAGARNNLKNVPNLSSTDA